jgi:thioredoxin-dependent peroxiredoxin
MPTVGQVAPRFELPDATMEMVRLSRFKGKKNVVLFFYPKDDTPACIQEATEFSDLEPQFDQHDTQVFGISRDDVISHATFRDKHGLSVQLLSDADGDVCDLYGVTQDRAMDGARRTMIARLTFIIDKQGIIRHCIPVANPREHAHAVLNLIKEVK